MLLRSYQIPSQYQDKASLLKPSQSNFGWRNHKIWRRTSADWLGEFPRVRSRGFLADLWNSNSLIVLTDLLWARIAFRNSLCCEGKFFLMLFLMGARCFVNRTMARSQCWEICWVELLPGQITEWCLRWAVIRVVNSSAASWAEQMLLASSAWSSQGLTSHTVSSAYVITEDNFNLRVALFSGYPQIYRCTLTTTTVDLFCSVANCFKFDKSIFWLLNV